MAPPAAPPPGPGIVKNSGWLRYIFDDQTFAGANAAPGIYPSLGATPVIVQAMSGHVGVNGIGSQPDIDGQLFGETPGHAAIVPVPGSLFAASPPPAVDQESEGSRGSGKAAARIPAFQKVRAFFQQSSQPIAGVVAVQTEIVSSQRRIAGVLETDAAQKFLASLRVALVSAPTAPGLVLSGMLWIEVQHSILDLPGDQDWSQVPLPPPG